MEKETRNAIERATQKIRGILEVEFAEQLQGDYDVMSDGRVGERPGAHLTGAQRALRARIVASIEHKRAQGMKPSDAVADFLRDAAFTTLNRFVALKMLEARDLVQECVSKGEASSGYVNEFCGLAPGLKLLNGSGYRLYIESIFDELSTEVKVLFDRREPASALWPRKAAFDAMLASLNGDDLKGVWGEDETIGWVYQFFNGQDERRKMREESQTPRNSREMAIRNQFFTPSYVVHFLTDNTLGRFWYEMRGANTALADQCAYMVRSPDEEVAPRAKKDPRDIGALDPACGSGHFLLYLFALLLVIYEEAYGDADSPKNMVTGRTLKEDYPTIDEFRKAVPGLILAHNLHGVDIDPRCAQIAQLALWMRAQKAYSDFGIGRAERPQIRRSNIVVAEPLVADEQVAKEFVAKLDDPELRRVFTALVEALNLAGDLGLLVRVESLVAPVPNGGATEDLFTPKEERIRAALAQFMKTEGLSTRRRLFADELEQGVELLQITQRKFDVVLTNPPFGTPPCNHGEFLSKEDCGNLYSAFVRRAIELGAEFVGCITDRTFLTQSSFKSYRSSLLGGAVRLSKLCDLGWGVLDANVQTAAYVLSRGADQIDCLDVRDQDDKASQLRATRIWKKVSHASLMRLPDYVLSFGLPAPVLQRASEWPSLGDIASLPRGLGSNKADRTYLAWVEVPLCQDACPRWEPLANGGEFSPWWREDNGVADWRTSSGMPWVNMASRESGWPYDQGPSPDYFRAGLSFPKQSASFNVAVLPAGFLPTREGKAIIPENENDRWWLLAYLNSGVIRAFVRDTCGLHKQSGAISRIPIPPFENSEKERLASLATSLSRLVMESYRADETSRRFEWPANSQGTLAADCQSLIEQVDTIVSAKFGIQDADLEWCERQNMPSLFQPSDTDLLSWAVGVVFGRFNERIIHHSDAVDPFGAIRPTSSPAMREVSASFREIAVLDAGHPADLSQLVSEVLACASSACDAEEQQPSVSVQGLARFLRERFFGEHVERYRVARRKAPIYWQIATKSASYSIWLFIHAFNKDTLFRVQNDYVVPKLAHEERCLDSLSRDIGDMPTAAQRNELAAQVVLVEELRSLLEEVKKIAPLWNPDLNDGVVINAAPLWRLFPQCKPWQKELKATWDSLCDGKYDWTHLAMYLWPDRVVPKCATDRSLAITHRLDEVFWVEGDDGKWKKRIAPSRPIGTLIAERSSLAVTAALKSLMEAPEPAGQTKRGRKTKAA